MHESCNITTWMAAKAGGMISPPSSEWASETHKTNKSSMKKQKVIFFNINKHKSQRRGLRHRVRDLHHKWHEWVWQKNVAENSWHRSVFKIECGGQFVSEERESGFGLWSLYQGSMTVIKSSISGFVVFRTSFTLKLELRLALALNKPSVPYGFKKQKKHIKKKTYIYI